MERDRFEDLLRSLAQGRSRRDAIGVALATLVTAGAGARIVEQAEAKKHKRHKKKGKKNGDACGRGKITDDGRCATPCTEHADCAGEDAACLRLATDNDASVREERHVCVVADPGGPEEMPPCPSGESKECDPGLLCVDYAAALVCAPPA